MGQCEERMHKSGIDLAKLCFLYSARWMLGYCPLPVVYFLGNMLGKIMLGQKAYVMKADLNRLLGGIFSESELHQIIQHAMQNFRKDLFEIWTFPRLTRNKINKMVSVKGISHLEQALQKGKGAILCVTHFGSWKIVLAALGYNGYRIHQIAANPLSFVGESTKPYHRKIMQLELASEKALPANFLYLDERKSLRPVYRALSRNEIVVIALDSIIDGKRKACPFFKGQLLLSTGACALSHRTGASLLPIFTVRQPDNRHTLIIHEPKNLDAAIPFEMGMAQWIVQFVTLFESYVTRHPEHYARFLYTIKEYPLADGGPILTLPSYQV